jgi:hypothetical protein
MKGRRRLLGSWVHGSAAKNAVAPGPVLVFSRLKDHARIALLRDKTRRSWMSFAHLAAATTNLRIAGFSHRAWAAGMTKPSLIRADRAPVLTLWAAVVTERLGPPVVPNPISRSPTSRPQGCPVSP